MLSHEKPTQNFNMDQTSFSIGLFNAQPWYGVQSHFSGSLNKWPSILAVSGRDGQLILNSWLQCVYFSCGSPRWLAAKSTDIPSGDNKMQSHPHHYIHCRPFFEPQGWAFALSGERPWFTFITFSGSLLSHIYWPASNIEYRFWRFHRDQFCGNS
jgi:hypothetical protein